MRKEIFLRKRVTWVSFFAVLGLDLHLFWTRFNGYIAPCMARLTNAASKHHTREYAHIFSLSHNR